MAYNVWNIGLSKWESLTSFKLKAQAQMFLDDVVTGEGRVGPFLIRKTADVLEEHGTALMQLKPSMIWRCAMDDLERARHNKTAQHGDFKQYAFHRRHVVKAETANDIIRAAIAAPGIGRASGKRDTRLLYADVDLLRAALQ